MNGRGGVGYQIAFPNMTFDLNQKAMHAMRAMCACKCGTRLMLAVQQHAPSPHWTRAEQLATQVRVALLHLSVSPPQPRRAQTTPTLWGSCSLSLPRSALDSCEQSRCNPLTVKPCQALKGYSALQSTSSGPYRGNPRPFIPPSRSLVPLRSVVWKRSTPSCNHG
jgi:hypothetical protein